MQDFTHSQYQANLLLQGQEHLLLGEVLASGDEGKHVVDAQS